MKIVLLFIGLILFSCSDNDDTVESNCEFDTLINAGQYLNAPSDLVTINSLEINGNCLKINFSATGCTGDTWVLKLIDSEAVYESAPLQRDLRLSLDNEELCGTNITRTVTFDISGLQIPGETIQLNIANSDQNILYEY